MDIHEIPLLLNSSTLSGAKNKSVDGSRFDITLDQPIQIPFAARNVTIAMEEAVVWWVMPNIVSGVNSNFELDDGVNPPYSVSVPTGLYNLFQLEASINSLIVSAGGASGIFNFLEDTSTQKVVIRINVVGAFVDFTIANSVREILGFASVLVGPFGSAPIDTSGANTAAFNTIEYFLIHTNLVDEGVRVNNQYSQIVGTVLIDESPGNQIKSRPFNPPKSSADTLIGQKQNIIHAWITDQDNNPVNTNGEDWTARLVIRYIHEIDK